MKISRQEYDKLPVAIREGALHLWGTAMLSYSRRGEYRQLYRFNNFFVETCYQDHHLTRICSFSTIRPLKLHFDPAES